MFYDGLLFYFIAFIKAVKIEFLLQSSVDSSDSMSEYNSASGFTKIIEDIFSISFSNINITLYMLRTKFLQGIINNCIC